ncbi:unnamed protein product [Angiostrongylus costaricensis]|uniref:Transmembrane protein n=1 Tax=Angiostrongylus costaricensis TaxID=334426 RepID=A0A0R3Q244_ANGCS|nr:unnamed protein product [Angiostrongylus costaricensis]
MFLIFTKKFSRVEYYIDFLFVYWFSWFAYARVLLTLAHDYTSTLIFYLIGEFYHSTFRLKY